MNLKNLMLLLFMIANTIAFSQSASTNTKNTNSVLMAKTLKAYQIKSENKIEEFYNLLNIIGNPEVKSVLKEQTIVEINKFFKDKNIKIENLIDVKHKDISLSDFLNLVSKSAEKITFQTENKGESEIQEHNGTKSWTIAFILDITKGKTKIEIYNVMHNVSLFQEEKQFGSTKKTVQNTYLTAIWLK